MAEIINLRQARKAQRRAAKEVKAAQNRAAFGRSKAVKNQDKARTEKTNRHLDAHAIAKSYSPPPEGSTSSELK